MPMKGPLAEKISFEAYHRNIGTEKKLTFIYEDIRLLMRERYAAVVNCEADQFRELYNVEYWTYLITRGGSKTSSPGMPYHYYADETRQIIYDQVALTTVVREAIAVLEVLGSLQPEELERILQVDPTFSVRSWLCDLVRIFIKKEPHPLRKKVSGKWRNIKSVSFRDYLVDLFLFGAQDDLEIENWKRIPSKPGLGLTDEGALSLLQYAVANGLSKGTDAGNWEATVSLDCLKMEAERRIDFCDPQKRSDKWMRAVRNRMLLDAYAIIMTSDGTLLQRTVPGQTLSGKKYTASMNSSVRVMLSLGASVIAKRQGAPIDLSKSGCMSMGDDAVEDAQCWEHRAKLYAQWGFELTDEDVESGISFCSHNIRMEGEKVVVLPLAPEKSIAHVVVTTAAIDELLQSAAENFRHHPRCAELCDLVRDMVAARTMKTKFSKTKEITDGTRQQEIGGGADGAE